jgi:2-oxoglutarate decarboxylase
MPSKPFMATDPLPETPAMAPAQPAALPESPAPARPAGPPPPPPPSDTNGPQQALDAIPTPVLGQLALPTTAAPRKGDSAILLWIALVVIIMLAVAVVVGAIFYVRSLGAGAGGLPLLDWPRWT